MNSFNIGSMSMTDVKPFLSYFTFLPIEEIQDLCKAKGADIRHAKETLAFEATKLSHGEEEAKKAKSSSRAVFGGGKQDQSSVPASQIELGRVQSGILVVDIFAEVGLTSSKGNARKLIQQGGAYVNQERVDNIEAIISEPDFDGDGVMLRAGKKRYHRLEISG
jgi:tyrosyl-tRNA synthetase